MHDVTKALLRALPFALVAASAAQAAPVVDEPTATTAPAVAAAPAATQPGAAAGCANCAGADCAHCPMAQAMAETAAKEAPPHVDCGGAK